MRQQNGGSLRRRFGSGAERVPNDCSLPAFLGSIISVVTFAFCFTASAVMGPAERAAVVGRQRT